MRKTIQALLSLFFLIIFIFLVAKGKMQLWLGIFLVSIALSFLLGRIYCGWICPINTVLKYITWAKRKLKIPVLTIPSWFRRPWLRIAFLALFIATFIFTVKSGRQIPVLPILFGLGIVLTLFFPEAFWHRWLCPYGTILSLTSSNPKHKVLIDRETCNNCGICYRTCPAEAIEKNKFHSIISRNCLVCMQCVDSCRQKAISYR